MAKVYTDRDAGVNANPTGPGVSKITTLGSAQQSTNDWLGINGNVPHGSMGPREGMSMRYGGDRDDGVWFKGNSVGVDSMTAKQLNAASGLEKPSWNSSGQYGPGSPNYLAGGFGAREQMTIGGDKNEGKLVGDGHNAIPDTDLNQYFISGKMQVQMPTNQLLAGSDEARGKNAYGGGSTGGYGAESGSNANNMIRAKKGIGKGYPRNDAKNQYD